MVEKRVARDTRGFALCIGVSLPLLERAWLALWDFFTGEMKMICIQFTDGWLLFPSSFLTHYSVKTQACRQTSKQAMTCDLCLKAGTEPLLKRKHFPITSRCVHSEDLSLRMTLLTPVWTVFSVRFKLLPHEMKRLWLLYGCLSDRADLREHHVGVCVWVLCECWKNGEGCLCWFIILIPRCAKIFFKYALPCWMDILKWHTSYHACTHECMHTLSHNRWPTSHFVYYLGTDVCLCGH